MDGNSSVLLHQVLEQPHYHNSSNNDTLTNQEQPCGLLVGILTIEAVIGCGILFTNALVLVAFSKSRKLRSSTTNYYLLQLAFADFMTGLFTFFHIAFALVPVLKRSEYGCLVYYCIMLHVCTVSMMTLMGITLDRFVAITSPFYHRSHKGKRRTKIYCIFIHTLPLVACVIVPFAWHNKLGDNDCDLIVILKRAYIGSILIPLFLIVTISKTLLYCMVYHKTKERVRMFRQLSQTVKDKDLYLPHQEKAVRMNTSLAKTGALVVGVFIFCWTPFFIVLLMQVYAGYHTPDMEYVRMASFLLILLSSFLDPIIYIYRIPAFRKEVFSMLFCPKSSYPVSESSIGEDSFSKRRRQSSIGAQESNRIGNNECSVNALRELENTTQTRLSLDVNMPRNGYGMNYANKQISNIDETPERGNCLEGNEVFVVSENTGSPCHTQKICISDGTGNVVTKL